MVVVMHGVAGPPGHRRCPCHRARPPLAGWPRPTPSEALLCGVTALAWAPEAVAGRPPHPETPGDAQGWDPER